MPTYSNSSKAVNSNSSSPWPIRLDAADKQFGDWHSKFKCDTLESYYEGFQWKSGYQSRNYNPYTLNLFYSTIKIKLANFLFQRPSFIVTPRPGQADWNYEFAARSSIIKQDTLNTIISNPNMHFVRHMKLAALDSFFRYGLIEVGYSADWRNPQQPDPMLASWEDNDVQEHKDKVVKQEELPFGEQFYTKRIRPKRFRISAGESTDLDDAEWCGYYEYAYTNVLKKTKGINFPKHYASSDFSQNYVTSGMVESYSGSQADLTDEIRRMMSAGSISKIWHIFDLVAGKRCLYLCDYWDEPLWDEPLYRLPLIDVRWDFRTTGFYPIPPCFQWLTPQDEINEAREQTRSYRRRFTRKFQAVKGKVDEEELDKFASGPDGTIITVKEINALSPIENPTLGSTTENALLLAKDDFILVSGSSAEVTKSDRETATKSAIEDQRAKIRESAEQLDFSAFLCKIGRELLCQAQEKMAIGIWAKMSNDPGQQIMQDMQINGPQYQYITNQDISDGYDFDIMVNVEDGTPAAMQQAQADFVTFLTLIQKFPVVTLSPLLIRKTAYVCNFRDEQVIQQMQQAAILQMAANANAQTIQNQGKTLDQAAPEAIANSPAIQEKMAQMESPAPEIVEKQIQNQIM